MFGEYWSESNSYKELCMNSKINNNKLQKQKATQYICSEEEKLIILRNLLLLLPL